MFDSFKNDAIKLTTTFKLFQLINLNLINIKSF